MTRVRLRGEEIRNYILQNVQDNPSSVSKLASDHFKISRQAVNAHLNRLVKEGALREKGTTRNKAYELAAMVEWEASYSLGGSPSPAEDYVWRTDIEKVLVPLPDNQQRIWHYGFTEVFNNAVDHSEGTEVGVKIIKTAIDTVMVIADDGVGIFRKIQKAMGLEDERHAILELSKGKLTTDPARHSGEGLFFTSRVFDGFDILSGGVYFSHEIGKEEDWVSELSTPSDGTAVFMRLSNHSSKTISKVFDEYAEGPDAPGFNKTVVPVRLARYGKDQLISRSQAKRVMARVELFSKVILNFEDVEIIGQAFADEVFRVFVNAHPQIKVIPIHTNQEIEQMITRVYLASLEDRRAKPSSGEKE
jgi:anti-sigma regulatory factor (Ser/Thr protein kinase)/biotin operon repressor